MAALDALSSSASGVPAAASISSSTRFMAASYSSRVIMPSLPLLGVESRRPWRIPQPRHPPPIAPHPVPWATRTG